MERIIISYLIYYFDRTPDLVTLNSSLLLEKADGLRLLPFNFLSNYPEELIRDRAGFKQTGYSTKVLCYLL